MKKILAIVLTVVMCLSLLPMAAAAAGETYIIAGTEYLCGTLWDTTNTDNQMTDNGDGTYSKVYTNVPAGTHEFKVTNGTWDACWPGTNYIFEVSSPCDVTITFNPADGSVNATGANVSVPTGINVNAIYAVGTGSASFLNGATWDPAASGNMMTANGKVYTITYKNVAAGSYEVKFAANGEWTHSWGGAYNASGAETNADYNGSNIAFSVSETSDVTLKLDLSGYNHSDFSGAKFTITVSAASGGSVEEPTEGGNETADTIKVYAKVPESWTAPRAWAWKDDNGAITNAFAAWPGESMTQGEDGWWYIEVPAYINFVIINDGGSSQTSDLAMTQLGSDIWVVVAAKNGVLDGEIYYEEPDLSEVTEPTTQPTEKPTEAPTVPSTAPVDDTDDVKDTKGGVSTVVTVIVSIILIAGAGVAGFFVTKAILAKKKAQ